MEGIGFLYLLLVLIYFAAFLFSGLLILHFLKIKPATSILIVVSGLALALSFWLISSELMFDIPFGALLIYTACVYIAYMVVTGFSDNKALPRHKKES